MLIFCREETGAKVDVEKLDLASLKSVRECAQRLLDSEDKIDILINNAGKERKKEKEGKKEKERKNESFPTLFDNFLQLFPANIYRQSPILFISIKQPVLMKILEKQFQMSICCTHDSFNVTYN